MLGAALVGTRGLGQQRLDPGIDDEAVIGDLKGMPAAHGAAAAEFRDLDRALSRPDERLVGQLHNPIDHRVLGPNVAAAIGAVEQEHRAIGRDGDGLHLVDELIEPLLVRRRALCRRKAVEYQDGHAPGGDLPTQEVQQAAQPVLAQYAEAADVA